MIPGTTNVIFPPLCNRTNVCFLQALYTMFISASSLTEYCSDCREQCSTTDFIVQKSSLVIEFERQDRDIKHFVENSNISLPTDWWTTWSTHVEKSYLKLQVMPVTSNVESITQTAALDLIDVVSNIGGQTGLWIGISFLSIMELIEIAYRLLRHECHMIYSKIRKTTGWDFLVISIHKK